MCSVCRSLLLPSAYEVRGKIITVCLFVHRGDEVPQCLAPCLFWMGRRGRGYQWKVEGYPPLPRQDRGTPSPLGRIKQRYPPKGGTLLFKFPSPLPIGKQADSARCWRYTSCGNAGAQENVLIVWTCSVSWLQLIWHKSLVYFHCQ